MIEPRLTMPANQTTSSSTEGNKQPFKKVLFIVLLPIWLTALAGFTSTWVWIGLSVTGTTLVIGGIAVSRQALPHIGEGFRHATLFAFGLLLIAISLATLAPGAPGNWLTSTSFGWGLLEKRVNRLILAIEEQDHGLAIRIASRGLGNAHPIDESGHPLLFKAQESDMLRALLATGLGPDAETADGRTLLMLTKDVDMTSALLKAGADPNTQDVSGKTPLVYASRKDIRHLELLLEAGANVHAVDVTGIAIADYFPATGPQRNLLEEHSGPLPLPQPRPLDAMERGHNEWLVVEKDPQANIGPSSVTTEPEQLIDGHQGTIHINIGNDSHRDRLLEVRVDLNGGAYLVAASHNGKVANPLTTAVNRTIRWPLLALPAYSEGKLSLDIVNPNGHEENDLMVDVAYRDSGTFDDEHLLLQQTPGQGKTAPVAVDWMTISAYLLLFIGLLFGYLKLINTLGLHTRPSQFAALATLISLIIGTFLLTGIVEPWIFFEETSCLILDRRLKSNSTAYYSSSETRLAANNEISTISYVMPQLAVRYKAKDEELTSVGFTTGNEALSAQDLYQFPLGATVTCWFDPDQPSRFTVNRVPGLGAIASIVLLVVVTVTFFLFARVCSKDQSHP
jgi:hypothetical protein